MAINPLLLLLVSISTGITGQMLLKAGMIRAGSYIGRDFIPWLLTAVLYPQVLAGFLFFGVSLITWIMILSRVQLSYAYPMLGLSKVMIVFLAFLFFAEPLTWQKLAGSSLVFAGLWILGLGM